MPRVSTSLTADELTNWRRASSEALRSSNTTLRQFLSAPSCPSTTICVVNLKLSWFGNDIYPLVFRDRRPPNRLLTKTLRGVKKWGEDGLLLTDGIWKKDFEEEDEEEEQGRQELVLKRGRGDEELAGSSSSHAEMKKIKSRAEDLHAVVTSPTCNTLILLGLRLSRKEHRIISDALRSSPTLKHLLFWEPDRSITEMRTEASRELIAAVSSNNKLQTLSVEMIAGVSFAEPEHLSAFLRNTTSLIHLDLGFWAASPFPIEPFYKAVVDALVALANKSSDALVPPANKSSITFNKSSITFLSLARSLESYRCNFPKDDAIGLIKINTLLDLSLEGFQFDDLMLIMKTLENNHTLQRLSLAACQFDIREEHEDQALGAILDALSKSGLPQLDLARTQFEGNADIEAQLAKNAASYTQALKAKELAKNAASPTQALEAKELILKAKELIPATAVRLFLCGDPHAGKTTLLRTLMFANRSPCALVACPTSFMNRAKVCFCGCCWSTPTEEERTRGIEVHTLVHKEHQVSVWDLAGQAEYHAFHDHIFPNLSVESSPAFFLFVWSPIDETTSLTKPSDAFETSFSYWLKFVTSKTRKSNVKRRVLVVLTRKDKVPYVGAYMKPSIQRLKTNFDKIIELVDTYEVDAREPRTVGELSSGIFATARVVLTNIQIYKLCNQVREYLSSQKRTKGVKSPIMTYDYFCNTICKSKFKIDDRDIAKAVAVSLHEVGDVIYLDGMNLMVCDANWFCHDIMGNLIHSVFSNGLGVMPPVKGFYPKDYIQRILGGKEQARGVDAGQLVDIMQSLHLCCPSTDGSLFIPSTLSRSSDSQRVLKWRATITDPSFVGRRLECEKKSLTFLTPGLFPLIQVAFNNAFLEKGADVQLGKHVMAIYRDAVEILVEFCEVLGDNVIDVMVRLPKEDGEAGGRSLRTIDDVVTGIIKICADSDGNQGVELEVGIIRPECLHDPSDPVSSRRRENQCVSMKDLKKDLEKKLRSADSVLKHTWKHNDHFGPGENFIKELLGVEEFAKVVEEFEDTLKEAAEQLEVSVESDKASKSDRTVARVDSLLVKEAESRVIGGNVEDMTVESICKSMVVLILDTRSIVYDVHSKVDLLSKKVDDMAVNIAVLRSKVLPELESRLVTLLPLLDEKRLPCLCFLTKGLGVRRRMLTAVVKDLQSARLELFCEDRRGGPHHIDHQVGISITALDEGIIKKGLPYFRHILHFLSLASKVGAGLGNGVAIPDISSLIDYVADSTVSLDKQRLPKEDGRVKEGFADFHDWQQWLRDVLEQNGGFTARNIEDKFKLKRARYRDNPPQVAWLCANHYALEEPFPLL